MIDEQEEPFGDIVIDRTLCPLETARKDVDFGTDEVYDPANLDHVSEWTMAMVYASYKQGQVVPFVEFHAKCVAIKNIQFQLQLEEDGMLESYWDGGGVAYRTTKAGDAYVQRYGQA